MPSPHISSVHFRESVLQGDMASGSHAEPRRRWRSLSDNSIFRVRVGPHWLKGATHVLKSITLLGVELAGDRESSGTTDQICPFHQPLSLSAATKWARLLFLPFMQ